MTPEETIKRIAEVATDVAWQAGVGSMELAGQFVSVLTAHPEKIEPFLSGKLSLVDDADLFRAEMGCLSWHTKSGEIISPAQMRGIKQHPDS